MKNEKLENITNVLKNKISCEDKLILIVSFIAGLITHFYFYTNECLSPDAVWAGSIHISGLWEVSLGRWGLVLVDLLKNGLVNHFLITIVSILALSVSTMLIVKIFKIKNYIIITLMAILMVVTPQVTETLMFAYCADSYCLAMLFAVLSTYFIYKGEDVKNYILAIFFIILELSLYQAYIGVTVTLCMIIPLSRLIEGQSIKEIFSKIFKSIIVVGIGTILYYTITQIILYMLNITLSSYGGANNIGQSTIKYLFPEIMNTYKTFYGYFFKDTMIYNTFWHRNIINIFIFMLTLINMMFAILKNKIYKEKLKLLVISIILIILPIGVNIINIIAPERNNNLVMGMSYVVIYIFILKNIDILKESKLEIKLRYSSLIFVGILLCTFILSNNASYMARKEVYNNYYSTSMRILNRIENYKGYNKDTKVLIGGLIKHRPQIAKMGNGFISNDYETWNNYGGTRMINNFYKDYMGMTIKLCNEEEYLKIIKTEEYKKMDVFPYDNSVKMIDGILVVKIEEEPPIEHK